MIETLYYILNLKENDQIIVYYTYSMYECMYVCMYRYRDQLPFHFKIHILRRYFHLFTSIMAICSYLNISANDGRLLLSNPT